jgi:hypothetical protein
MNPDVTYVHDFPGPQALAQFSGATTLSRGMFVFVLISRATMPGLARVALIASAGSNSWGSLAGSTLTGVGVALVVVVVVVLDDDDDDVAVDRVLVGPEVLSSLLRSRTNDATATMIATTTAPPMRYTVRLLLRGGTG